MPLVGDQRSDILVFLESDYVAFVDKVDLNTILFQCVGSGHTTTVEYNRQGPANSGNPSGSYAAICVFDDLPATQFHVKVLSDMGFDTSPFHFKEKPSDMLLAEIATLEQDGYFIHREWANGVELRKRSTVGSFGMTARCLVVLFIPVIFLPFFGRPILDVIQGYKFRILVTREMPEPRLILF